MMAPSIVMISAGFWPALGGAERQALELSRVFVRRGSRVVVLTRRVGGLPKREEIEGIIVRRLPASGPGTIGSMIFMAAVFAWLLKNGAAFDVFHAHLAGSPALAAAAAGQCLGVPVCVKLGGGRGIGEIGASSRTLLGQIKLLFLKILRPRFIAVADDLANEARAHLSDHILIDVVPNGVDTDVFHPVLPEEKARKRAALGWPQGTIFLYTGRLAPEKRLDWFARACGDLFARRNAFLIFVGNGPEERELKNLAASSSGHIRLVPAVSDPVNLYAAADIFVLPSLSEGLSNSLLEAMASGLPIIASAVGGSSEALENEKTGLLFPRDDAAAAALCARRVLDDPRFAAGLGDSARRACVERYSLESVVERLAGLYR